MKGNRQLKYSVTYSIFTWVHGVLFASLLLSDQVYGYPLQYISTHPVYQNNDQLINREMPYQAPEGAQGSNEPGNFWMAVLFPSIRESKQEIEYLPSAAMSGRNARPEEFDMDDASSMHASLWGR